LTPLRRRALNDLLNQYLALETTDEQQSFVGLIRERYPRLARWFVPLAQESRTTTSLFTRSPAPIAEGLLDSEDPPPTPDLEPGARLGPWRIRSYVGAGGMGKVYRGERADDAFEMDVAIKLIGSRRSALADHLRHECQLLARLDHPGVTRLIDAGVTDEDEPFLVMEWVEGEDLELWLGEHIDLEARLNLFREVAEAVAHAHQRLIVHGDIKPGNIRITSEGRVKLMDFGVARLLEGNAGKPGGIAALTPAFAAPEQRQGQPITTYSDMWSLGAFMAWMLGGNSLHVTDNRADLHEHLSGRYSRGQELAAIICMACADDPDDRYASVTTLAAEVDRFRNHQPLQALPGTPMNRLGKAMRRNRALTVSLATIISLLAGGLTATSILYFQAESQRERAERQAHELEQVVNFQTRQIDGVDVTAMAIDLRSRLSTGEDSSTQLDSHEIDYAGIMYDLLDTHILEPTQLTIDQSFAAQPLVRARLLQSLASSRRVLGLLNEAEPIQETVLELVNAHADAHDPVRLSAIHHYGLLLLNLGDPEKSELNLRKALEGRKQVLGAEHPDTLSSKREMAMAQQSRGDLDNAERYYRETLETRQRVLGKEHPQTLDSLLDIGVLKLHQAEYDQAEDYFQQALQGRRAALGDEHPETLTAINNLGVLMRRMGRMEDAKRYYAEALEGRKRLLGNDHPDTLMSLNNQAVLHQSLGELISAEAYYREALEGYRRIGGKSHPQTLNTVHNIGVLRHLRDDSEAAKRYLRQALEGRIKTLGKTHHLTLVSKSSLAQVLRKDNRPEEALELTTQVLELRREQHGDRHPQTVLAMTQHGANLREVGRLQDAESLGSEAIAIAREILPPDHWRLATHLTEYAKTLAAIGEFEHGEELLLEAYEVMQSELGDDHVRTASTAQTLAGFYKTWNTKEPNELVTENKLHWQEVVDAGSGNEH
jgi:eukaryotic-like serine/threonine-protein kinase